MTATYQSIGAKVNSIILRNFEPKYVPLSTSNPGSILLQFRARASLIVENPNSGPNIPFYAPADIFVPVVLLNSSIDADEVCRIVRARLFDQAYTLNLRSLTPLSNILVANAYKYLSDSDLPEAFAKYFSPDSTVVPAFILTLHPSATFFNDLKDVLRPIA